MWYAILGPLHGGWGTAITHLCGGEPLYTGSCVTTSSSRLCPHISLCCGYRKVEPHLKIKCSGSLCGTSYCSLLLPALLARRGTPCGCTPLPHFASSRVSFFGDGHFLEAVSIPEDSPRPRDLVLLAGRLVGWNASGEFAAAFPTVSRHGDVVTAWKGTTPCGCPPPPYTAPSPEGVNKCDHTDMECVHAYTAPARSMPRGTDGSSLVFCCAGGTELCPLRPAGSLCAIT